MSRSNLRLIGSLFSELELIFKSGQRRFEVAFAPVQSRSDVHRLIRLSAIAGVLIELLGWLLIGQRLIRIAALLIQTCKRQLRPRLIQSRPELLRIVQPLLEVVLCTRVIGREKIDIPKFDVAASNHRFHLVSLRKFKRLRRKLLRFAALVLFQRDAAELEENSNLLVRSVDDSRHIARLL